MLARRGGSWLEPGLGASRCSKVLGLPKMVGRLREIAEFTTDGWLQRCAFGIKVSIATLPGEQRVKVGCSGGGIGTSQEDVCKESLFGGVEGGRGQVGHCVGWWVDRLGVGRTWQEGVVGVD